MYYMIILVLKNNNMNNNEKHYIRIINKLLTDMGETYDEIDKQIRIFDKDDKVIMCYIKNSKELFVDNKLLKYLTDVLPGEGWDYVKPAAKKYFNSQIDGEYEIRSITGAHIV